MRHDWRRLGLIVICMAFTAVGVTRAAEPPDNSDKAKKAESAADVAEQLRQMNASLKQLTERIKTLEINVADDLAGIRTRNEQTNRAMKALREDVDRLRTDFDGLANRVSPNGRISAYAGPNGTATLATGRVRLVNTYFLPQTIVVNRKAYDVPPNGEMFTDPVPAGTFSYEVLGVQPRSERLLVANETFTIHVHPR